MRCIWLSVSVCAGHIPSVAKGRHHFPKVGIRGGCEPLVLGLKPRLSVREANC